MKNLILIVFILLQSNCSAQEVKKISVDKSKSDSPISIANKTNNASEIIVDISTMKVSKLDQIGFNTENTFGPCNINDPKYKNLFTPLNPDLLRFPGGTIANFYHFEGKGYGFVGKEIEPVEQAVAKHLNRMLKKNEALNTNKNYIEKFVTLAKSVNAEVLYVANITTGSPAEALKTIKFLQDNGLKIKGIELGNELYLEGYKKIVPNAEKYVELAMPFVNAFRKSYPTIPLAIAAESRGMIKTDFESKWNEYLSKRNFYDAFVVHVYPDEPSCDSSNLSSYFNCAQKELSNFVNETYPAQLTKFSSKFNGKKMWITEWNMKKPGQTVGGTNLQALYAAQLLLKTNEWNTKNNSIDLLVYHNLSAEEYGYAIINPTEQGYIANPAYYTFELLSPLSHTIWKYEAFKKNSLDISVFYNLKENIAQVYIINQTNITTPNINVTFQNGEKTLATNKIKSQYLSGNTLYSTNNKAGFLDNINNYSDKDAVLKNYNSFSLTKELNSKIDSIPAYSFTRITYQLNP